MSFLGVSFPLYSGLLGCGATVGAGVQRGPGEVQAGVQKGPGEVQAEPGSEWVKPEKKHSFWN